MSEKKKTEASKPAADDVSRRGFIKTAALGAGATAAAATMVRESVQASVAGIARPKEFSTFKGEPLKSFQFPATGADVFAKACKDEGVGALFCCPGNYGIITALANQGIPAYGGRTEGSMCSAADGFTRVTGEVSVASGTEGPGFTNMICAIAAANACRTPLLVVASNMSISGDDTEGRIQRGYQQPTTEGLKKYGKRILSGNRIHEYAGYAFRQLKSGVPGPVHLDFVSEVAGARFEDEADLERYHDKDHYRTDAKPHPDPKQIDKAVEMIKKAKRPIIVASTGVFYSHACDQLKEYAEKTNIPVTESGPMRGKFPDDHPLSASMAYDAYASADLVVLIGQYCMPGAGGRGFLFSPDARYIRIDPAAEEIGRNLPIDVGIVSCEKAAIEALIEATPAMKHDSWVAEIQAATKKYDDENDQRYKKGLEYSIDGAIHPSVIAREIENFLYKGDIDRSQTTTVSGGFGIGKWTRRVLKAYRPGQICNGAYQYGSIGPDLGYLFGVGQAVQNGTGYQAAHKGAPVLGVTGDAGFGYSGMELETLAKYRVPAIQIVYNNNAWGTWTGGARDPKIGHAHLFQENLRYDKMAEALGANGEYATTPDELKKALHNAWEVATTDSIPTLINCQAKKEYWSGKYTFIGRERGMTGTREPGCEAYSH